MFCIEFYEVGKLYLEIFIIIGFFDNIILYKIKKIVIYYIMFII